MNRTDLFKTLDALVGAPLCRVMAWLPSLAKDGGSTPDTRPETVRRILLIRPGGMGDMVLLLPAVRLLQQRFPSAELTLVCERRNLDVLRLAQLDRCALLYDSNPLRFLRQLLRARYDVAVDSEQFHHFSAVFALLSRARVRIGFKINPLRNPLYTHLVNYAPDGPEGSEFLRLLGPLGIRSETPPMSRLATGAPPEFPAAVRDEIARTASRGGLVVIHPGASTGYKHWPAKSFVELALRLDRDLSLLPVFAGDAGDRPSAERIREAVGRAGGRALSFAGRLSLAETAAVLRRARLFVGTDSGLAHLAVALEAPTVVLFGPSDAKKWGATDARHAVVQKDLPCAPCFIFGYHKPCRSVACMQQISVDDVLEACRRVL